MASLTCHGAGVTKQVRLERIVSWRKMLGRSLRPGRPRRHPALIPPKPGPRTRILRGASVSEAACRNRDVGAYAQNVPTVLGGTNNAMRSRTTLPCFLRQLTPELSRPAKVAANAC